MADLAFSLDGLDDSSGENIGDGLDSSALDLSGSSAFGDFSQDTLQGSALDLAGTGIDQGVTDPLSLDDQFSLSGVTDPIASETEDLFSGDNNGTGSAVSTHPATVTSASDASTLFSGMAKFGTSIGQLFFKGAAPTSPTLVARNPNVNPNRTSVAGITSGHAVLLVGVVVVIGVAIAMGGK